jgi:1-acyl-sn-glycerol-3-phosphate acyltransferase
VFYAFVKLFFAPLVRIYLRLTVRGAGAIPASGGAIVVANHASFLDPIVLGSACPRQIHFIVLQSMYDWWRLRWFYWGMHTIPVRAGEADPKAIRQALTRLRSGEVVGLFPEGGRSGDGTLQDAKVGAALLAALSGVPVVPCWIQGAHQSLPPGAAFPLPAKVTVTFGTARQFQRSAGGKRERADLENFSSALLEAIARLKEGEPGEGVPAGGRDRVAASRFPGSP